MRRIIDLCFNARQKRNIVFLTILVLGGGILELLGVSVFLPLVDIILNPSVIHENIILAKIAEVCSISSGNEFLMLMCVGIILLYVFKNIYLLALNKLQNRFVYNYQYSIRVRMMELYLHQAYVDITNKNSALMTRCLVNDIYAMADYFMGIVQLISEIIICAFLIIFLAYEDFGMTFIVAILLFVFSIIYFKPVKRCISQNGIDSQDAYQNFIKWINQSWGSIKEIKIFQKESYFCENFGNSSKKYAKARIDFQFLSSVPKYVLETLIIVGFVLAILLRLICGADLSTMIAKLSVFVVAAFRLLPSVNRINAYYGMISFNKPQAEAVINELEKMGNICTDKITLNTVTDNKLNVSLQDIHIKNVSFSYSEKSKRVLDNVTLDLHAGQSVGIIGPTGSGKTTFVDILLGLISPTSGEILYGNQNINTSASEWNSIIGYIPQNIYILDDTIRNNIAFGLKAEEIDDNKVWEAVKKAQLYDFVSSLPNGLDENVGERGAKLSGGQCQRIGIARALYRKPLVLVLDEATANQIGTYLPRKSLPKSKKSPA